MTRKLGPCIAIAFCAGLSAAAAQTMRTEAPCSPVIGRTQGNVTINISGGCSALLAPAQIQQIIDGVLAGRAIPPEFLEKNEQLAQRLGVTDTAVTTFFRIMGERKVAVEDLDAKLREIAARHLTLLKQIESLPGEDPLVEALKKGAVAAVSAGDYARAESLLQQAFDADLVAARKAQDAANRRFVTAAKTKADLGQLKLSQLQYDAAAREFQAAADLLPASEPLVRAQYLSSAGQAAVTAGAYPRAAAALTEALRIRERLLPPDNIDVAASLSNLAALYQGQARYAEAELLYKRALAIEEQALGPEHSEVGTLLNNFALLYHVQRRYAEAEPLYKRSLAIKEKLFGPEHTEVATSLNNIAALYQAQDRYAEAEPLVTRSAAIKEKLLSPDHPEVAISLNNLAMIMKARGSYAEAEPLFKRAIVIIEKALGPDHPNVATGCSNLADLYDRQGRRAEAEPLYKRALAIREKVLGADHPDTAAARRDLQALQQAKAAPAGGSRSQ